MDNRPIGMFDSGIGGLTVYEEVKKQNPNEQIIYLGDTKRFPYGSKSKEAIIEISKQCVEFLIKKNVKLIIIACGTATSQALEIIQKDYNIPIIGIIQPTIEKLKKKKETGKIGVIATKGTIKSDAWRIALLNNIKGVEVINNPTPLLAPLAECGWVNNKVAESAISEYMKPIKDVDKIILGCTHYPLFTQLIKKELGDNVEIINIGEKLAKYLQKYLNDNDILSKEIQHKDKIYLTDIDETFAETAEIFLTNKEILNEIEKVELK